MRLLRNGKVGPAAGAYGEALTRPASPGPKASASGRVGGTASHGEALVTGPASRALGPVSGRCLGEYHRAGAERSGGFRGVAPGPALFRQAPKRRLRAA